ncbi:MAG: energy transducer TonB [Xanthomonadaceae bacterium]|nr:energy transducer TonB [Xanthomonadaceae bacterium]
MKRVACLLLSLFIPALGLAAEPHVEGSMLVTGTITVNPQGGVQSYAVQGLDKLPLSVRQIIQTTVPGWQFVPIMADGKAVTAEAGMSLRIVADMVDAQHATIRVAGAAFGCDARPKSNLPGECPAGTAIRYVHRQPPDYPIGALQADVGGEVFLVLQIGRDGHVSQAAVRQVNLYSRTDSPAQYRKVLANAALRAASKWQFSVPTTDPNATKDHWVVQVPVNYTLGPCCSVPAHRYGQWNAYLPGPVQNIPWDHENTSGASRTSADAIASGGLFVRDTRFVLKTALVDGGSRS